MTVPAGEKIASSSWAARMLAGFDSSLWLLSNHLFVVQGAVFAENYRRFAYRDIHRISIRKTAVRPVLNVIFILAAALSAGMFFLTGDKCPALLGVALLFVIFFSANTLMGPTAKCVITTGATSATLPALGRLSKAISAADRIREKVQSTQGVLSEYVPGEVHALTKAREEVPHIMKERARADKITDAPGTASGYHSALFVLLLLSAVVTFADLFYQHIAFQALQTVMVFSVSVVTIAALVRQHDREINPTLVFLTWSALGYVFYALSVGVVLSMYLVFEYPEVWGNQWLMLGKAAKLTGFDNPVVFSLSFIAISYCAISGSWGLLITRKASAGQGASK